MIHVLGAVYSLPFAGGALLGILGHRLYCHQKARHEDRIDPLPDGGRRPVGGLSRIWVGGLIAILSLGYVMLISQKTQDETLAIAERVGQCSINFNKAQKARSDIATADNQLANDQSDLRLDLDDARQTWLNRVLNPPGEIAEMQMNDPRRQTWTHDVTVVYFERAGKDTRRLIEIANQRRDLADERTNHPLPDVDC